MKITNSHKILYFLIRHRLCQSDVYFSNYGGSLEITSKIPLVYWIMKDLRADKISSTSYHYVLQRKIFKHGWKEWLADAFFNLKK